MRFSYEFVYLRLVDYELIHEQSLFRYTCPSASPRLPWHALPSPPSSLCVPNPCFRLLFTLLCPNVAGQMPLKRLAPDGHLHLIEGVLGYIIGVQVVNLSHNQIYIGLLGFSEQQELGAAKSLEAGKSEDGRFEYFQPCPLGRR